MTFRPTATSSTASNNQIVWGATNITVSKGGSVAGQTKTVLDSWSGSGNWDCWLVTYNGQHSHGISEPNSGTGHSHGITQNNHSHTVNSDGISESRPDNFTYKIWKRIL